MIWPPSRRYRRSRSGPDRDRCRPSCGSCSRQCRYQPWEWRRICSHARAQYPVRDPRPISRLNTLRAGFPSSSMRIFRSALVTVWVGPIGVHPWVSAVATGTRSRAIITLDTAPSRTSLAICGWAIRDAVSPPMRKSSACRASSPISSGTPSVRGSAWTTTNGGMSPNQAFASIPATAPENTAKASSGNGASIAARAGSSKYSCPVTQTPKPTADPVETLVAFRNAPTTASSSSAKWSVT